MRVRFWLACFPILAAFTLAQASLALQNRAETLAFVVQVAVHYGPQRDALLSGVVAADGRTVLTDPGSLEGAQEISVAFTDLEVLDADARPGSSNLAVGIVDLRQVHGPKATLAPADAGAAGELEALAGGAPESFRLSTVPVRLRPMRGAGAQMRWDITPVLPTYYRGGALLDAQGRVLGLIVRERDSGIMVGVPLRVFADLAGANPARPGAAAGPVLAPRIPEAQLPLRGRPAGVESKSAPSETGARAGQQHPGGQTPFAATPARNAGAPPPAPRKIELPTPVVSYLELPIPPPATGWVWRSAAPPPPTPQVARTAPQPPPATAKPPSPETAVPSAATPETATRSAGGGSTPPERQAVPEPGEDVLRRIRWANEQSQYGNRAGAVASLEDALKTYPDQTVLYYHLGFAYWSQAFYDSQGRPRKSMERGAYRKAVRAFESFLARASPDDPKVPDAKAKLELLRSARFGYKPK